MSLAVAIQMDPIDAIDINGDSTFALALEAQARGHGLYHYLPQDLSLLLGCRWIAKYYFLQTTPYRYRCHKLHRLHLRS